MVLVLEAFYVSFLNVNWLPFPPQTKIPSFGAIDANLQALMQLWWLLLPPLQMRSGCCLHLHLPSKLETSKFEMGFVFIQSFCYCYLLSKCKACIVFVSSLNAHLGCCLCLCFVSKHKGQECLCYSSTHYLGPWPKTITFKCL